MKATVPVEGRAAPRVMEMMTWNIHRINSETLYTNIVIGTIGRTIK